MAGYSGDQALRKTARIHVAEGEGPVLEGEAAGCAAGLHARWKERERSRRTTELPPRALDEVMLDAHAKVLGWKQMRGEIPRRSA